MPGAMLQSKLSACVCIKFQESPVEVVNSLIQQLILLRAHHVPAAVLGTGTKREQKDKNPVLMELTHSSGGYGGGMGSKLREEANLHNSLGR